MIIKKKRTRKKKKDDVAEMVENKEGKKKLNLKMKFLSIF